MSPSNEKTGTVDELSIGEFARRSRLSPKALRLYDELGLLTPARVDESSGYRFYDAGQLERARLVATLRQLQMPLAEIKAILDLEPAAAARAIADYWAGVETEHSARRRLAGSSSTESAERGRSCTKSRRARFRHGACFA